MKCDACGVQDFTMEYIGIWGEEGNILTQFIFQKTGKNWAAPQFNLCGECSEEYKKFLSQNLKDKIITELASQKSVDCQLLFSQYGHKAYFKENDWTEVQKALIENIQHYRNEWRIDEMNYNRDGEEYFHPETNRRTSKLTVLIHQSAPVEHSSNGFLIVKQPKMYLKSYFSPNQWSEIEKNLVQSSSTKPQFPPRVVLVILGILLVTGLIILTLFFRKRKKVSQKSLQKNE